MEGMKEWRGSARRAGAYVKESGWARARKVRSSADALGWRLKRGPELAQLSGPLALGDANTHRRARALGAFA